MFRIAAGAALALLFAFSTSGIAAELNARGLERLTEHAANAAEQAGRPSDPETARALAQAVADAIEANPEADRRDAVIKALNKGRVTEATRRLNDALDSLAGKKQSNAGTQAAHILLALARLSADPALERRAAEAAVRHDPKNPAAQGELAAILVAQDELVAAESAWRTVINNTPGQPEARRAALAPLITLLDERAKTLKAEHARGNIDHPYELAEQMNTLGELYGAIMEKISAAAMHHRALQVLESTGDTEAVARQWELLGRFYEYFDEPFRAYAAYQKAISLFDRIGDAARSARIRNWIHQKRLLP